MMLVQLDSINESINGKHLIGVVSYTSFGTQQRPETDTIDSKS